MRLERETMNRHTSAIEELAKSLSGHIQTAEGGSEPAPIRQVSEEEAIAEITKIFQARRRQDIYYSDLMDELHLDLETVIKACEALESRGFIMGGKGGRQ
jgi:hypothetical protein